ncbi:substrate-binding domain-containing protein [Enterococcus avium]
MTNQPATDGLFAINDFIALESLIVLRKMHKKIPDDLKIIGFDDIPQDRYSSPTLSSIKQDTEKIALKAVESLLNLIDNKADRGQSFVIPVTLV